MKPAAFLSAMLALVITVMFFSAPAYALSREEQVKAVTADSRMIRYDVPLIAVAAQSSDLTVSTLNGAKIGSITRGKNCYIIGESEKEYYVADLKGNTGYVQRSKVKDAKRISLYTAGQEWDLTVDGLSLPFLMIFGSAPSEFSGMIKSNLPLTEIAVDFFNFRNIREDCGIHLFFTEKEDIRSFDLSGIKKQIPFSKFRPGDRYMTVTVRAGNLEKVIYNSVFCVSGNFSRPYSAVKDCTYSINASNLEKITDGSCLTGWKMGGEKKLKVTFPKAAVIDSIQLEYLDIRHGVTLRWTDGKGNLLSEVYDSNPGDFYILSYSAPENAAAVEIACDETNVQLSELYVFEKGKKTNVAQKWTEVPDKVDVMLVVAHRNDECLFFGGIIPWCVSQGKTVAVVYMTDPSLGRPSYTETLNALWILGLRTYPLYLHMVDERQSWERNIQDWGGYENMYGKVAEVIRKYKPDVVIGHDLNGEFGHYNHILTADATLNGVLLAGDPSAYPESAALYGTWDVPKYYIHLYNPDQRINVDFNTPLECLMNLSPLQTAYVAFEKHTTEAHHSEVYSLDSFGKDYDNTCFGLYRSLVGPDIQNNSFFENLE